MRRRADPHSGSQTPALPRPSRIVGPSRAELRSALDALPENLDWQALAAAVRPVFVRRRPLPPGAERPLTFRLGPGLTVAVGVDIGPAFMYVSGRLLETWPISADEALEQAMTNLRRSVAAERYFEMEYAPVGDMPVWWYQSQGGLASGLLLLEDELTARYGKEPRLLAAPMRNLLLCAPFDVDRELFGWLRDEIADEDPNALDLPLFALIDGHLAVDRRDQEADNLVH